MSRTYWEGVLWESESRIWRFALFELVHADFLLYNEEADPEAYDYEEDALFDYRQFQERANEFNDFETAMIAIEKSDIDPNGIAVLRYVGNGELCRSLDDMNNQSYSWSSEPLIIENEALEEYSKKLNEKWGRENLEDKRLKVVYCARGYDEIGPKKTVVGTPEDIGGHLAVAGWPFYDLTTDLFHVCVYDFQLAAEAD